MAKFNPIYSITNSIANNLLEIERVKEGREESFYVTNLSPCSLIVILNLTS